MKTTHLLSTILAGLTLVSISHSHATTYAGNGKSAFEGIVGASTLMATDDGSGGLLFSFLFANGKSFSDLGSNDIVIYLDNGTGGGISDTTVLTGPTDGGQNAIAQRNGNGSLQFSTTNFGGYLAPQFGLDLSAGYGDIFSIISGSALTFIDGTGSNTTSASGLKYNVNGSNVSIDLPASDFGGTPGQTESFLLMEVSNTGYSSDEGTVTLTGTRGFGGTQTVGSVNTFVLGSPVPEASTVWMLVAGAGVLVAGRRFALRAS